MATIKDIARIAGVSVSTVSHVVNGTRYVSPEKVEKVEAAIRELDQLPNFIVKKTKTPKRTLGQKYILILLSERCSLFQAHVCENLEKLFRKENMLVISQGYDKDEFRLELIRNIFAGTTDLLGIIAFPDGRGILSKSFFEGMNVPVVLIGDRIDQFETDVLLPDTFEGGYRAVRHLIKNGHEKIAFLSETQEFAMRRFEGYKKALEDHGIAMDESMIFSELQTEEAVFGAMKTIMSLESVPTALVIADSLPLVPVFKYLNARHILVPRDISVVSLNDFKWATLMTPEVTCVDKQPDHFAAVAAEILLKRIRNGEVANDPALVASYCKEMLLSQLNVRASTCGIGRGPFGEKAESADVLVLSENEKEMIRQKNYTAAISFHYTGKAWMRLQEKGIKKIFNDLGISLIAVTDAHFNADLQCKQLESIKFLKPDILISIPVDVKDTAAAFRSIADSDTKLVLITNIPDGFTQKDYISCISVNEHSHGRSMGHGLGEYMVRHGLKNVGLIRHGEQNFFATRQRDGAAEQVLMEEYPNIHVCGSINFLNETEVYKKTIDFIKYHPEIEALYVSWDGPALEVLKALTEIERTDIAVVTGDLDYAIAMNMAKGGMVKMLSAQCPYEQGEAIALAAANGLLGKDVPSFIGIEPVGVNQDNLLKSWRNVFREDPPADLRNAMKQNPNYMLVERDFRV